MFETVILLCQQGYECDQNVTVDAIKFATKVSR